jgi:hypothetical protein
MLLGISGVCILIIALFVYAITAREEEVVETKLVSNPNVEATFMVILPETAVDSSVNSTNVE